MENLNEVISKMTDFLKSEAKTETIIGNQFTLGEFTCVPVMSVGFGVGGGGGEGKGKANSGKPAEGEGSGVGAGAGMGMGPVGFLVTRAGEIQFIQARNSKGLAVAMEKLPEILETYLETQKKSN